MAKPRKPRKPGKIGRASGSGQFISVEAAKALGDTATVETIDWDQARQDIEAARERIVEAVLELQDAPKRPGDFSQRKLITVDELREILERILT